MKTPSHARRAPRPPVYDPRHYGPPVPSDPQERLLQLYGAPPPEAGEVDPTQLLQQVLRSLPPQPTE